MDLKTQCYAWWLKFVASLTKFFQMCSIMYEIKKLCQVIFGLEIRPYSGELKIEWFEFSTGRIRTKHVKPLHHH